MAVVDMKNKKYGRLTVLERVENNSRGDAMWLCQCDCGNRKIVLGTSLRSGHTTSCGCFQRDKVYKTSKRHGYTHTRIYNIWCCMKNRCYYEKNKHYKNYGKRGKDQKYG